MTMIEPGIIPTVGVLIIQDEKVLLIRHGKGAGHLDGVYGLPAGHIDEGESPIDAAIRELQEETGLITVAHNLTLIPREWQATIPMKDGEKTFSFTVYFCRKYHGELLSSSEGVPEWITIDRLDDFALLPNVKAAIIEGTKQRNNLFDLTREVLQASHLMSLGVSDFEGPWVADVIFAYDDDCNMYWMSTPERRHSLAIVKSPTVAVAITATQAPSDPDFGVQMSGEAKMVDIVPCEIILQYFRKRKKPEPKEDFVVLENHRWYKFCPARIELIDQVHFGYERQRVQ